MEVDVAYIKSTMKHDWHPNNDQQPNNDQHPNYGQDPNNESKLSTTTDEPPNIQSNKDGNKDSNIEKKRVENPKSESRISKFKVSRRARASPIDEGDEDVNDFINSLIKRVDKNLKWF